ncbi:MAG TPA: hypothetical protein ENI34_01800 [candidate division WOR-3 bacterium]|uniref:Uncharacterized protein n=1 Tax=candidate division WOR-3 bacterium TaxID=2052148 RepID=A0A9C9JZ91_UNCW3|nr:hypothetical protein [candidate division WOR-3 bacterium]
MPNFWNDLTKWLEEASKVVGKEAGDLTLKGRLKLEIFELRRKLRDNFSDLGALIFEQVYLKKKAEWKKNAKITALVRKIKKNQRLLAKKQAEYKKIGKQTKKKKR